jgi:hypothetical protein
MLQGRLWKVDSYSVGQEIPYYNKKLISIPVFTEVRH